MAKKKNSRRDYNRFTRGVLLNDLDLKRPVGGKFLKVGKARLLLTKTTRKDEDGNPVYLATVVKREGISRDRVSKASHVWVKPV